MFIVIEDTIPLIAQVLRCALLLGPGMVSEHRHSGTWLGASADPQLIDDPVVHGAVFRCACSVKIQILSHCTILGFFPQMGSRLPESPTTPYGIASKRPLKVSGI